MGKVSVDDKMRIQTLREQCLGYRAIAAKYPENWQLDGAPAHTAKLPQNWIATNCSDFIGKDERPPNAPDLNPLEYHVWGAMLDDMQQNSTNKAILSFVKRLRACVKVGSGHFEPVFK